MSLIREAKPEDTPQIEACIITLQDFERSLEVNRNDSRSMSTQYLEYMFSQCVETSGKVFVAESEGRIAGYVCVLARVHSTSPLIEKEPIYGYISDLAVLPSYRGRGFGKALLQQAEDYALSQGTKTLRLTALAKNEIARNLYNAFGFQDYEVTLVKRLST